MSSAPGAFVRSARVALVLFSAGCLTYEPLSKGDDQGHATASDGSTVDASSRDASTGNDASADASSTDAAAASECPTSTFAASGIECVGAVHASGTGNLSLLLPAAAMPNDILVLSAWRSDAMPIAFPANYHSDSTPTGTNASFAWAALENGGPVLLGCDAATCEVVGVVYRGPSSSGVLVETVGIARSSVDQASVGVNNNSNRVVVAVVAAASAQGWMAGQGYELVRSGSDVAVLDHSLGAGSGTSVGPWGFGSGDSIVYELLSLTPS